MPYSLEINDVIVYNAYNQSPRAYTEMIKRQFDQLYLEGADSGTVMCIPLHGFLVGQAHRIGAFQEALDYILAHDKVWVTTAREIADYFYAHYYDVCLSDIAAHKHRRRPQGQAV